MRALVWALIVVGSSAAACAEPTARGGSAPDAGPAHDAGQPLADAIADAALDDAAVGADGAPLVDAVIGASDAAGDAGDLSLDAASADGALADAGALTADAGSPDDAALACPRASLDPILTFTLTHAAFPGSGHPDVAVHVPPGFDPCAPRAAILFFHGHNNCAANVLGSAASACTSGGAPRAAHRLAEILDRLALNVILIAVQLRYDQASSDAGDLAIRGECRAMMDELFAEDLSPLLGRPLTTSDLTHVVLASHSGGYRALARCLELGDLPNVSQVDLYDSLYGEIAVYNGWIQTHLARFDGASVSPLRYANVFTAGGGTAANSRAQATTLMTSLAASGTSGALLFDDTTSTLTAVDFERHPLLIKRSALSHDGVVPYYFERLMTAAGLPALGP